MRALQIYVRARGSKVRPGRLMSVVICHVPLVASTFREINFPRGTVCANLATQQGALNIVAPCVEMQLSWSAQHGLGRD